MKIVKESVKELYKERSKIGNNNSVLGGSADKVSLHTDIYIDYFTKVYLLKFLKPKNNDTVLDFGCGVGRLSKVLAKKVDNVLGLDITPELISIAKNEPIENVRYEIADNLNCLYESFTKIFTVGVLYHLDDEALRDILCQFKERLANEGRIVLIEHSSDKPRIFDGIAKQRTLDEWQVFFNNADLDVEIAKPIVRIPSYSMGIWKKLPRWRFLLPLLLFLEEKTLFRKREYVDYYYYVFVLSHKNN